MRNNNFIVVIVRPMMCWCLIDGMNSFCGVATFRLLFNRHLLLARGSCIDNSGSNCPRE